jgi:hypothetical protein
MDHVANDFRRVLGLKESDAISEDLINNYKAFQKRKDVASAGKATPGELIMLTLISGYGPDGLERNGYEFGQKVKTVVKGETVTGEFLEACDGEDSEYCHVNVDGDEMKYQKVLLSDTAIL